jgi:hypothetical protein
MAAWLFQANPDDFIVDTYLRQREKYQPLHWRFVGSVRSSDAAPGDTAFVWRANGKARKDGGLIAVGRLSSYVERKELRSLSGSHLWIPLPAKGLTSDVVQIDLKEVRLTWKEGMVPRELIECEPLMSQHQLITARQGSAFSLSQEQERRLLAIWSGKRPKNL